MCSRCRQILIFHITNSQGEARAAQNSRKNEKSSAKQLAQLGELDPIEFGKKILAIDLPKKHLHSSVTLVTFNLQHIANWTNSTGLKSPKNFIETTCLLFYLLKKKA